MAAFLPDTINNRFASTFNPPFGLIQETSNGTRKSTGFDQKSSEFLNQDTEDRAIG